MCVCTITKIPLLCQSCSCSDRTVNYGCFRENSKTAAYLDWQGRLGSFCLQILPAISSTLDESHQDEQRPCPGIDMEMWHCLLSPANNFLSMGMDDSVPLCGTCFNHPLPPAHLRQLVHRVRIRQLSTLALAPDCCCSHGLWSTFD